MIRVRHLFISSGHNYLGHHGKPAGTHPIQEAEQVECVAGRGIRDDRYFDFKENPKRQISFFAHEVFQKMCDELGLKDAHPRSTRRNVITAGVDLNTLIGCEFEIQGVRFVGLEECRPCYWMNSALRDEQAETWLKGNGGLRARILTDGVLRCDVVQPS